MNFPPIKGLYRTCSSLCGRASRLATLEICHREPRVVGILRSFSERVTAPIVIAPSARSIRRIGSMLLACSSAALIRAMRPTSPATRMFEGFPSFAPIDLRTAGAAFVRSDIRRRSFSASAAYRCSMKGSASRPSSATMNGTRCAISPATKATSRDRRSSLETRTQHLAAFAWARAAASCGRRSIASAPSPVSASTYSAMIRRLSASAKRANSRDRQRREDQ
jgi:hypothetical protein